MRKVTASAVILTALTGCGQNGGVPSTQWSFEIPTEDEISSLVLNHDSSDMTDGALVSSIGDQAFTSRAGGLDATSNGAYAEGMMGPAFKQPSANMKTTGLSTASSPGRLKAGSSISDLLSSYRPVAARPDPVAQVKAFLSANGSPNDLISREPYRSDILTSSLPTVYLPSAASVTSTSGEPTNMESRSAYADDTSFTSTGLPTIEPSVGGLYAPSGISSSGSSALAPATVALNPGLPTYQQGDYPVVSSAASIPASIPVTEGLPAAAGSSGFAESLAMSRDGLPMIEANGSRETPIGTAILQDLQRTAPIQAMQSLPAEDNVSGSIDIDITPAEAGVAEVLAAEPVASEQASSDQTIDVSTSGPTLESLQRSMVLREVSPLVVAYASQPAKADLAVEPNLTVEAIAVSNPDSSFPTLESLLETMPETATQPNFTVDLSDNNAASPLLESLNSTQPLSTLYLPIPESAPESSAAAGLPTNVSVVSGSLASLADSVPVDRMPQAFSADVVGSNIRQVTSLRSGSPYKMLSQRATLSLVDKLATKGRQLVTY